MKRAILVCVAILAAVNFTTIEAIPKRSVKNSVAKSATSPTTVPNSDQSPLLPNGPIDIQSSRSSIQVTDVGPELGSVAGLAGYLIDAEDPKNILAVTDINIFKSTDGGKNWHAADAGLESFGQLATIANIRNDPNKPHVVYAVGDSGLFRSTDFGDHWIQISNQFGLGDLAVSPASPSTLFILGNASFYRSDDGGVTLVRQTGIGLPDVGRFLDLVFTPADPQTMYVVDEDTGVYKSTDGGNTFNLLVNSPFAPGQVFPHPTRRDTIYLETLAESATGLFRSTDGGASFTEVRGGLPAGTVQFVTFDDVAPETLYVASTDGLLRSTDGGFTFTSLGITPDQLAIARGGAVVISQDPASPQVLYVSTAKGNFKSTNRGRSFTAINNGFKSAKVTDVEFDSNGTLYVVANHTLFRSRDPGQGYEELTLPRDGFATAVGIAPTNPSDVLVTTLDQGVLRSVDGGHSWTSANIDTSNTNFTLAHVAFDPHDAHNIYVVAGTLYRSTDGGRTFTTTELPGGRSFFSLIAIDPQQPQVLYVSGGNGLTGPPLLIKSIDAGLTFAPALTTLGIVDGLAVDPNNPNTVFVAGVLQLEAGEPYPQVAYRVAKSIDAGSTFSPSDSGLSGELRGFAIDPIHSSNLFYWMAAGGLFETHDSAASWSPVVSIEAKRRSSRGVTMAINPTNPTLVYLAGNSLLELVVR